MVAIWEEQQRHVGCIQDTENLPLYSKISTVKKGAHYLPVYRCARGSNSLESFHSHVVNFIPGKSANAVHFQAFLLDGLSRWNTARKDAVEDLSLVNVRTFDQELTTKFDVLHEKLFGNPLLCKHHPSSEIDEYIGMEYLFHQCGKTFDQQFVNSNIDELIDSGFEDEEEIIDEKDYAAEENEEEEEEATIEESNESIDSLGIPGWDKVDRLAKALIDQEGISLSREASNVIIRLYQQLDPYDRRQMKYEKIKMKPATGRYLRKRKSGAGVVAMRRVFVTGGSACLCPSKNRIVEAICIHLSHKHAASSSTTSRGNQRKKYQSRWKTMIEEYNKIRARLFNSTILQDINLTLFNINETTLTVSYTHLTLPTILLV